MTSEEIATRALDMAVRVSIARAQVMNSTLMIENASVTERAAIFEQWIKNATTRQSSRNR